MNEAVTYRSPRPGELAECALVWHAAVDDYMRRLARPLPPPYLDPLLALLAHLLTTDPERFVVAVRIAPRVAPLESPSPRPLGSTPGPVGSSPPGNRLPAGLPPRFERIVGFGIAVQREHVWFLSQLYVLPEEQRRGIGRALLTRVMPSMPSEGPSQALDGGQGATPPTDVRPGVLATCTDSTQPVSNGLYGRFGIVARMPVFNLVGRPIDPAALPALPEGIEAIPLEAAGGPATNTPNASAVAEAIDAIDRAVLGYAHPADHAFLRTEGRTGFLYRTSGGDPIGYGYSSKAGRFGPVALLDETLTAPVVAHLLTAIEPRGASSAWIPGANDRAMVAMLRAGLRIEGFPGLMCWTRPFAAFELYMPAGLSLL
jgi:ribosomal protein S18 acetylase RimI-like enzyme